MSIFINNLVTLPFTNLTGMTTLMSPFKFCCNLPGVTSLMSHCESCCNLPGVTAFMNPFEFYYDLPGVTAFIRPLRTLSCSSISMVSTSSPCPFSISLEGVAAGVFRVLGVRVSVL